MKNVTAINQIIHDSYKRKSLQILEISISDDSEGTEIKPC